MGLPKAEAVAVSSDCVEGYSWEIRKHISSVSVWLADPQFITYSRAGAGRGND